MSAHRATRARAPRLPRRCCQSPPPGSGAAGARRPASSRCLSAAPAARRPSATRGRAAAARPAPLAAAMPDPPRPPSSAAGCTGRRPGRCRSRMRERRSPRGTLRGSPLVLDGQVGQAARRVEHTGLDERAGRARRQAQRARSTLIEHRLAGLEIEVGDDLGQEDPGTELGIDQARVLADPAKPGVLRVNALLHGSGVDVAARLEFLPSRRAKRGHQRVEPTLDDRVVVVAPGVARDRRAIAIAGLTRVRTLGVVDRAEGDDGTGRGRTCRTSLRRSNDVCRYCMSPAYPRSSHSRRKRSSTWSAAGAIPHRSKPAAAASRLTSADVIEAAIMQVLRPPAMAARYCRSS